MLYNISAMFMTSNESACRLTCGNLMGYDWKSVPYNSWPSITTLTKPLTIILGGAEVFF